MMHGNMNIRRFRTKHRKPKRTCAKFWLGNLKGRNLWRRLGMDGKIVFKWMLGK
jgi:hypothetical protein